MPYGLVGVTTLGELLARIQHAGGATVANALEGITRLLADLTGDFVRLVIEVAHPADARLSYIACATGPTPKGLPSPARLGAEYLVKLPIGWTAVSDERPAIATRRDDKRPTASLRDRTVELWGCGGLGSWMGEFIARAGVRRITLRDNDIIDGGGLLVRQNYVEDDIGIAKAERLAARLRTISDDLEVDAAPGNALDLLANGYKSSSDILIDATINVAVAARLDEWTRTASVRPLMAQVATDPRTATLGMLLVASPGVGVGPATIDDSTHEEIGSDPAYERFHGFWTPFAAADQLVPALGCSVPTFHGSAADLACLAGSLVSLLANHIDTDVSGAHLIESSHARTGEAGVHRFIEYTRQPGTRSQS